MVENKDLSQKTDEELAGLTAENPDFYYFLMARYEAKIIRYINRITNYPKEVVEDLGQEIFIKAYENINDFDRSLKFSSWLYRIAHNHVISHWRKRKKESKNISLEVDEKFINLFEADIDLVKDVDKKILAEKMGQALGLIKPNHKDVLILRFMEGKDYNEISDILRCPVGTVGTLISRAKKELRIKIMETGITM